MADRFTLAELHAIVRAEIKDRSYLATRLGPAVQEYLAWKRLSRAAERTLDQYERDLARLALAIPDTPLEDVAVSDLMLLLDLIPEGSWHRFRAAWNGLFRWAQRFGRRADNPVDQLPELKRQNTKPVFPIFSLAEQQALLSGTSSSLLPIVDYARVLMILETGARKAEAIGLRFEHIDLRERAVLLHGKGSKDRIVPIRAELVHAIDRLLVEGVPTLARAVRSSDYLWFPWHVSKLHKTGETRLNRVYPERPWSARGFHEWWTRMVGAAEISYRKPHMTRHTFATDLLDAGVDSMNVRELLGHESTRTTELYVHSSRRRLSRAADQLAAYRSEGEQGD